MDSLINSSVEQINEFILPGGPEQAPDFIGRQLNLNFTTNLQFAGAGFLFIALALGYYFNGKLNGSARSYVYRRGGNRRRYSR